MSRALTLGVVDVGTNSIHLAIGAIGRGGRLRVLRRERHLARLGEGSLVCGQLTAASMRRALNALARYADVMKRCGVDRVEAVATSAVREAANGRAFVRRVRQRLRLPLRIISGREEARLIYLGVLRSARFRGPTAIVTIGGGSAQAILGDGVRLRYVASVPLGSARLAQRFIRHDPPRPEEVAALRRHTERTWAPVVRAMRRLQWQSALGSSAIIEQLMAVALQLAHRRQTSMERLRLSISRDALRRLVNWLATSRMSERLHLSGLDPQRQDQALPAGMALLAWMEGCGVSRLRFAPGSLREGLMAQQRDRAAANHRT